VPLMSSRIPLTGQEPESWRKLWKKAQHERDPKKLDALIKQMNQVLIAYERRSVVTTAQSKGS